MFEGIKNFSFFLSSAIVFLLGYYVFLKDPKGKLNRIFFIFSLAATFWGLASGILRTLFPGYPDQRGELIKETWKAIEIFLLENVGLGGAYSLSPLFLNLCLIITEKKEILKRKITYFLLYFPPFFVLITGLIYDFYFTLLNKNFPEKAMLAIDFFSVFYFEFFLFFALFLLFKKYFSLKSFFEKKKLRYFLIGTLIPALLGSFISIIFPVFFHLQGFGWLTYLLYTIGYIFVAVGVLGHRLFIDYREILDTIFDRLAELLILIDEKGFILLANKITCSKLGFSEEEIKGKKIDLILKEKEKVKEILEIFKKPESIFEKKINFLTKEKKEIPFLIKGSLVKGGLILVGQDVSGLEKYEKILEEEVKKKKEELEEAKKVLEIKVAARTRELKKLAESLEEQLKERTKELRERLEELEKFYKLAVDRELKIRELKREIKRLKEKFKG